MRVRPPIALLATLLACGGHAEPPRDVPSGTDDAVLDAPANEASTGDVVSTEGGLVAARPFALHEPSDASPSTVLPLVILLHGYGASGSAQDLYFGLSAQVRARQFRLALPDGTVDTTGSRFWDATDACCNFTGRPVDDVAYVRAILDDVSSRRAVDPHRVYVIGHSNGGFMSNRIACDLSDRVAAIVSLAGANWQDMTRCAITQPVSVLLVHGTADSTVAYAGGMFYGHAFPGAIATADGWAMRDGCNATRASAGADLDVDTGLPGSETHREAYGSCPAGIGVELWSIQGGEHIPALGPNWATLVLDWMFAHPKP